MSTTRSLLYRVYGSGVSGSWAAQGEDSKAVQILTVRTVQSLFCSLETADDDDHILQCESTESRIKWFVRNYSPV